MHDMLKRLLIITMTCCFLTMAWAADNESNQNSLSRSVHQAQSQGKVLSAKTRNNEHVVKVLTPDGHIKTIKQQVNRKPAQQSQHQSGQQKSNDSRNKVTDDSTNRWWFMRILLIEDDHNLRQILTERFEENGFVIDEADNGEDGLFKAREYPADVAVIDLGLPKISGMEVIKTLRDEGFTYPVIVLTARGSWQDKVTGLDAGADDYLVKPFHFPELLARVNALMRRSSGNPTPEIKCGALSLNMNSQEVRLADELLELTSYEYKVLEYMLHHQDEVISKTELTEHIYHQDYDRDSNVIEVFIGRLRKKMAKIMPNEKFIETLRGRGYRISSRDS